MADESGKKEKNAALTDRGEAKETKEQTKTEKGEKKGENAKRRPGKRESGFFYEAMPVILLAVGTFLGICIYTDTNAGVVGAFFQRGFFGLVGCAAYAVPPLFLYAAIRFRRDYLARKVFRKFLFSAFAVLVVSVMLYTFGIPDGEKRMFASFFEWGGARRGGGMIGNYIGFGLNYTVSKAGTVIFAALFAVLFAIVFFDFNLAKLCKSILGALHHRAAERKEKRLAYAKEQARKKEKTAASAAGAFYGEAAGTFGETAGKSGENTAREAVEVAAQKKDPFFFPQKAENGERQFYDAATDDSVFDDLPGKNTGKEGSALPHLGEEVNRKAAVFPGTAEEEKRMPDAEEESSFSDAAREAKDRRIRELHRDFAGEDPFFTVEKIAAEGESSPRQSDVVGKFSADTGTEKGYAFSFDDESDFPSVEFVSTEPIPEEDGDVPPVVEKMTGREAPSPVFPSEKDGVRRDPLFASEGETDGFAQAKSAAYPKEQECPGGTPEEGNWQNRQAPVSAHQTLATDGDAFDNAEETPAVRGAVDKTASLSADSEIFGQTDGASVEGIQIHEAHVISHSGLESFEDKAEKAPQYLYQFPPLSLLREDDTINAQDSDEEIKDKAERLISTLQSFNVQARISCVSRGPRLTRYELVPEVGVRIRSIENLVNEIAMNLEAISVRIEAPIPGKAAIGVEVPNVKYSTVRLRDLLDTEDFRVAPGKTTVCLGVDVVGVPVFADLDKMPHLLVAGATGMGKSVCINSILVSLLYKARPDEVKLILIDPKKVEFKSYSNIPHLLVPVVTDAQKAAGALSWAVNEMERRYDIIEEAGVRNIKAYNKMLAEHPERERIPQIVIVIDELHDLMMQAPDAVEDAICRIAQKARAAGILLIIGTQRPSVNVITGVIKANIPSRIAFHVASQVDSRTILDTVGAEKLLNDGDMLFLCPGMKMLTPKRIQGAFLDDDEVNRVAEYLRTHSSGVQYDEEIMADMDRETEKCNKDKKGAVDLPVGDGAEGGEEELFYRAVEVALENGKVSTSLLQRKLSLGFGKAARMIDRMQEMGIVSPPNGQKPRDVLITMDDYRAMRLRNDE